MVHRFDLLVEKSIFYERTLQKILAQMFRLISSKNFHYETGLHFYS